MHQAGGLVKDILDELESELLQDLLRSTKPVQPPYPPVIVGGFRLAARRATRYGDGILPAAPSAGSGSPEDFMPRFRKMAKEAGATPRGCWGPWAVRRRIWPYCGVTAIL